MEENQETTNQTRPVMERKQISIPLVGGILIIVVGVVLIITSIIFLIKTRILKDINKDSGDKTV